MQLHVLIFFCSLATKIQGWVLTHSNHKDYFITSLQWRGLLGRQYHPTNLVTWGSVRLPNSLLCHIGAIASLPISDGLQILGVPSR